MERRSGVHAAGEVVRCREELDSSQRRAGRAGGQTRNPVGLQASGSLSVSVSLSVALFTYQG